MAWFRRAQSADAGSPHPEPDATFPIAAFPDEMSGGLRRMLTQITYQERFPARLSLIGALSGEGVTYMTLALATTLASDLNVRVCAVELNWDTPGMLAQLRDPATPRRKWVHKLLRRPPAPSVTPPDFPETPGLAGVLLGQAKLREAILPTRLPNLAFLPAGDMPAHQRPAMARGDELKTCISQLSHYFDHVLLDIPAVLNSSDAIALASLGEACCVVVRQGATSVGLVRQAIDDVKHLKVLGVVMNRARVRTPRWMQTLIPQE